MQLLKNKIKLKYILLEWSDEKIARYLEDETNYNEFMQTLSNILIYEPNYDMYIHQRVNFISDQIRKHNQDNKLPIYENFINKKLKSLDNFGAADIADFKTQYAYFYVCNVKLPYNLRSERTYEDIIRKNYENIKNIENIIVSDDKLLKENLKGDIFLLITINSILYENKVVSSDLIMLFEEIVSCDIEKDSFEDSLQYLNYKTYQKKTLKTLKKKDQKSKKLIR